MAGFHIAWFSFSVLLTAPAFACAEDIRENPGAVLELFTSQGCPNSPPADGLLSELAESPDIIALAYHVDYWDSAGWPDTFGDDANSRRQRDYSAAWGDGMLYTPQLVVNGAAGVVGSDRGEVVSAIAAGQLTLGVDLEVADQILTIDIKSQPGIGKSIVWLVTYLDRAEVRIDGGYNMGKTIEYSNVVTGRQALAMWDPVAGTRLKLPLSQVLVGASNGAAVLVREDRDGLPGPILGAASLEK